MREHWMFPQSAHNVAPTIKPGPAGGGQDKAPPTQKPPEPAPQSALDVQEGGDHYKTLPIQPVEYCFANNMPFIEGSVIKYVTRWRSKNGIADLKKARHFLDLLIELETQRGK